MGGHAAKGGPGVPQPTKYGAWALAYFMNPLQYGLRKNSFLESLIGIYNPIYRQIWMFYNVCVIFCCLRRSINGIHN